MSLNNRFPLKHGETVPPLSALWLVVRANYGTASTTEWSTSGQPPSKNTCITSGIAQQQMALLNTRCQFITLKIGELSCFGSLSLCTLTKFTSFIINSCWTDSTFLISKRVLNIFCPSYPTSDVFHFKSANYRRSNCYCLIGCERLMRATVGLPPPTDKENNDKTDLQILRFRSGFAGSNLQRLIFSSTTSSVCVFLKWGMRVCQTALKRQC